MFDWFRKKQPDEKVLASLMKAAVEGAERARAVRALATINIQIDTTFDDQKFCVRAIVAIIQNLAKVAEMTPIWLDDDRRFVAGIFAFTLSNALSYRLGTLFELTASTSAFILIAVGDDESVDVDARDVDDIASVYNDLTTKGQIIESIGMTFSRWLVTPTQENYSRLAALYKILGENVGSRDTSSMV